MRNIVKLLGKWLIGIGLCVFVLSLLHLFLSSKYTYWELIGLEKKLNINTTYTLVFFTLTMSVIFVLVGIILLISHKKFYDLDKVKIEKGLSSDYERFNKK